MTYDEREHCYYLTGSNLNENSANGGGAYQNIVLRKADTINGLTTAEEYVIWTDKTFENGTKVTGWYWAPELHFIDGKWPGAFDTTYFEHKGQSYYVTPRDTRIWITTVDKKDLLHPTGPLVMISSCDRAFEANIGAGQKLNMRINGQGEWGQEIEEASAVLIHDDKIFIAYAGCTVDMHYCVCLLYADADVDLLNPDSWKKYPYPVLSTTDLTTTVEKGSYKGIFGPGHNFFTVDESGNPVIIYHARDWDDTYPGATGDNKYGLVDPGRHAYAASVHFGKDGFPICNMSPEEILAESLREVCVRIVVK